MMFKAYLARANSFFFRGKMFHVEQFTPLFLVEKPLLLADQWEMGAAGGLFYVEQRH